MKTARSEQHTQHHIGAWFSHAARLGVAAGVAAVIMDAAGKASVASAGRAH